ncbi:ABC transporter ATP-binding protein [Microbacterium sp.]|uniref:ABC transporter ATP-binding protein n=1 Tax=Microbacterium sp. TaxID=51671 RepID=UPI003F9A92D5
MTAVIETRELQKKYGKHLAVDGIGLRVEQGSVFGLIGPNGAGKTTVLRMLVDVIRPTAGELSVLGVAPRRASTALRRRIGYLPGELKLSERIRGGALLHHLAQISGPVKPGTIEGLAERLGLDLSRPVRALSKGNRQKLGLVQAFMHRPELLILDEPTSGLDPLVQREFLAMVREAREAGQSILLSSHILTEIQHTADDVAVLAAGRIVAQGDVSALRLSSSARMSVVLADTTADAARAVLSALPMLDDLDAESAAAGELVRVKATIRGEADTVVKALAQFTVRDLTIEEPDLEESILDLYARTDGTS